MTEPKPTYATVTPMIDYVPDLVTKLLGQSAKAYHALAPVLARRADLVEAVAEIDRLGWTVATVYMRSDRPGYMQLIHPTDRQTGKRKRESIGTDKEKQAQALARIERAEERRKLQADLDQIDERLRRALEALESYQRALQGKRW